MRDESTIYKKKIGDVSMKKKVLTFIILFVLCRLNTGLCQEYLTLEQLKQQTPPRWVETYQDRYGRSTEVDIDIQIYGNTDAAIYKFRTIPLKMSGEKGEEGHIYTLHLGKK